METPPRTTWLARNWKWFVPAGCLSLLLVFGVFVAAVLTIVFGSMKSSDAYRLAMDRARASGAVVEALGTPVEEGFFVSGNVSVSGPSGSAELAIPVRGPRGKGTVYVEARKSAGEWTFTRLVFEANETKQRLDLLDDEP
jgi:hypothetical protein